jgi:chondroitin AC lyase
MFSKRNRNMEMPYNGPGKPTHHRADGTNYLQLKGDEYHNIWPVYDWQKISGTTIVQKPKLHPPSEIQKGGLTDFVGAVTDGSMGAVAFDFVSPHDFVEAKKAWFFFDAEYVCLGTGIRSEQELPVATTINQVLMRSEVTVSQSGKVKALPEGNRELEQVEWVHQDRVGYIFPQPTTVRLSNRTEAGRWSDITDQKNISDAVVAKKVFMLWLEHGESPQDASYQYVVVPDVTLSQLDKRSKTARKIEILANTPQIQAVEHTGLGIAQIAFYEAGGVGLSDGTEVRVDGPGMVLVKMREGLVQELSVSDPTRKHDTIKLTMPGVYDASAGAFHMAPSRNNDSTTIVVTLPEGVYAGQSVTCGLQRAEAASVSVHRAGRTSGFYRARTPR